jgi:hypothetical protein
MTGAKLFQIIHEPERLPPHGRSASRVPGPERPQVYTPQHGYPIGIDFEKVRTVYSESLEVPDIFLHLTAH